MECSFQTHLIIRTVADFHDVMEWGGRLLLLLASRLAVVWSGAFPLGW